MLVLTVVVTNFVSVLVAVVVKSAVITLAEIDGQLPKMQRSITDATAVIAAAFNSFFFILIAHPEGISQGSSSCFWNDFALSSKHCF